jgi:hypothetical protein
LKSARSSRALDLIFLLAGCEARRGELRERSLRVLAAADQAQLAVELASRRLLPLIGGRALELDAELCTPAFAAAVDSARTAARARGMAIEAETRRLVALLAEGGIPALPLKGPLLAAEAHGDIGLRDTRDVDLLVARTQLDDARRLLTADGYLDPADPLRGDDLPDLHFALDHPTRPSAELHWRVHWYETAFSEQMMARAAPGTDGLLRPAAEDALTALLLFYARDGFHGIRGAADVAGWWDRRADRVPPGFLEPQARRHKRLAPALTAAAAAVERLTGAPATGWIGGAAATGRRVALAVRLADWTQAGESDQLAANIALVDGLLGPPGSAPALARRQLTTRAGGTLPHAVKTLARWAAGLWRVRRGRQWSPAPAL